MIMRQGLTLLGAFVFLYKFYADLQLFLQHTAVTQKSHTNSRSVCTVFVRSDYESEGCAICVNLVQGVNFPAQFLTVW